MRIGDVGSPGYEEKGDGMISQGVEGEKVWYGMVVLRTRKEKS